MIAALAEEGKRERIVPLPQFGLQRHVGLEIELQTKPHAEWQIVYRVQLTGITGRLAEVGVRLITRTFSELIDQADFLIVRYVEEVAYENQFHAFSDFERVIAVQ